MADSLAEDEKANAEDLKNTDDRFKEKQRLAEANAEAQYNLDKFNRDQKAKEDKAASDQEAKEEAERLALKQAKNEAYWAASRGLSEAFFAVQLSMAKGNAAKELEIKKRAFQVDKAFNVARAIQDGIGATQKALAAGGGVPTGIPFALATGALAAANIAKILATKFDGGSAGGAGSVSDIGGGNVSVPTTSAPTVNTTAPTTQASTTFDEQGRNNNFNRVYVVESDISRVQNRVAKIEEQATI
jgi:hypothetical protein